MGGSNREGSSGLNRNETSNLLRKLADRLDSGEVDSLYLAWIGPKTVEVHKYVPSIGEEAKLAMIVLSSTVQRVLSGVILTKQS